MAEREHTLTKDCWCNPEVMDPLVDVLDAALSAIVVADSLDQARGIAHAALNREEYHGHEVSDA